MPYLLIIDDDEDFTFAVATMLRNVGYEVAVELDVQNAINSLKNRPPDLIILDVMFPENNAAGFELARKIKQGDEQLKDIPILMLTAVNSKFSLGFSDSNIDNHWLPVEYFLEKPIDLDMLNDKVAKMLS